MKEELPLAVLRLRQGKIVDSIAKACPHFKNALELICKDPKNAPFRFMGIPYDIQVEVEGLRYRSLEIHEAERAEVARLIQLAKE